MLTLLAGGAWGAARIVQRAPTASAWSPSPQRDQGLASCWQPAQAGDRQADPLPWSQVPARDLGTAPAWQIAEPLGVRDWQAPWQWVTVRDLHCRGRWDRTWQPRQVRLRLLYNPRPAKKQCQVAAGHRRVNEYGPRHDAAHALQDSLYVPGAPLAFYFGGRPYTPSNAPLVFFDFRYQPTRAPIQPADTQRLGLAWGQARTLSRALRLPWAWGRVLDGRLTGIEYVDYPGPVKPLPPAPPTPDILDTYMIANTVNLVVLPSRTPIEARNIKVSLDADSFSWKFSADIFTQAALDLVKPGAEGAKEIELDINGWLWVLLVERYSRNRSFPGEAFSISGATRSQLLAEPYAPFRTALNNAPISARQAAEAELLNTGFSLSWDSVNLGPADWTFPTGALSYQGQTAMQVIARIAETVGAVVRPERDADRLEVRPRYPAPPWEWNEPTAPVERIIPPAMMTDLSGEWTPQPAWNACYVSGTSHGVSMLVRRAGTAGDNPTPDVFDDWLTGEEANRARGVHELSKGGNIEIVGMTIPLFPAGDDKGVGLVLPAMLCQVPEEAGTWVGLCLAVEISATGTGAVSVKQQLKLERHH